MSANTSAQQLMWARCSDAWCFSARSWQAGFAAVLAPEGQLKPSLPRLADSVEELLWAPTTALGLAHDLPESPGLTIRHWPYFTSYRAGIQALAGEGVDVLLHRLLRLALRK